MGTEPKWSNSVALAKPSCLQERTCWRECLSRRPSRWTRARSLVNVHKSVLARLLWAERMTDCDERSKRGIDEQRSDQRFGIGRGHLENIESASSFLNRSFSGSAAATDTAEKNFHN